jgi:choline dehydrogenase-like flavoprotein
MNQWRDRLAVMLHQIRPKPEAMLSPAERRTLLAVAEAAMPPGKKLPGAGPATVERVERFLAEVGPTVATAYRALITGVEAASRARTLRSFPSLDLDQRVRVLAWLQGGDYLRRFGLRALLAPLKIAHFDDDNVYQAIGCVWKDEGQRGELPRVVSDRTLRARDLPAGETLEADVVVIGTGAGGAVVARELAERGLAVLMLEEGEYYTRKDFTTRAVDMQRKLYRDMGATFSVGNTWIPIPIGRAVGGTTTINSGTCYRVPERVLAKWRRDHGLSELTMDALAPHYERVEAVLGVTRAKRELCGGVASVIARGCEALGYTRHGPLPRNAPDCDGQGVCCFGCPTDAKRSTNVSYVPLALRAGAQLLTGAKALRVLVEHGRAVGVSARAGSGSATFTVRARAVVVSGGALMTPVLLSQSGLGGTELGKHLSIHPAAGVWAWFDEPQQPFSSIPQGYGIEEFHDQGILFEGGTPPLEVAAGAMMQLGPRFVELMESIDKACLMGFLIEDSSRGRVHVRGGRPFLTYVLNDADVAKLKRGIEIVARIFFAAGARTVVPMVHGFDELRGERDLSAFRRARLSARDFDLTAYHPLGTARMGRDPRHSVVGPDHELHDAKGAYVVDGAAVPSSLAVNPQLTIMAMASRAAGIVAERLGAA